MRRYLLVALWPAGLAAITAATAVAVRRGRAAAGSSRPGVPSDHGRPAPAGEASPGSPGLNSAAPDSAAPDSAAPDSAAPDSAAPDSAAPDTAAPDSAGPGGLGLGGAAPVGPERTMPDWLPGMVQLAAISAAGGVLSYELMVLLGGPVVKHGPRIDVPIMEWTSTHQVEPWAVVLERLNKVPNTWTTWGACGAAAACLAAGRPAGKWLPPSVLGAAIVVDHYVTLALRHKFHRPGPPASPLGTYPSGGCDRVVLFYGLIANLVWREFSGSQRGRAMALGATSLLAFNAAYCRQYLSKHWFTDVITGLVYGAMLYVPFAAAIRLLASPPARPARLPSRAAGLTAEPVSPDGSAVVSALMAEPRRAGLAGRASRASAGQREGAAAGVGEPVRTRPAAEHGW
jgi:membrane-associated phospholipid phosphatase